MSTSYPTLAVIREFGITDEAQIRAIWVLSNNISHQLWEREGPFRAADLDDLHTLPIELTEKLVQNLRAAHQWCLDNADPKPDPDPDPDPDTSLDAWKAEVAAGDTELGYQQWLELKS